jgi:hypothetical protein
LAAVASCQTCWNIKHETIIKCTHQWFKFTDPTAVGAACDFGAWASRHTAIPTSDAVAWSCHICHAMACSGCHVG